MTISTRPECRQPCLNSTSANLSAGLGTAYCAKHHSIPPLRTAAPYRRPEPPLLGNKSAFFKLINDDGKEWAPRTHDVTTNWKSYRFANIILSHLDSISLSDIDIDIRIFRNLSSDKWH